MGRRMKQRVCFGCNRFTSPSVNAAAMRCKVAQEKLASCQRLALVLLALTELKWYSTLRSMQTYLWENRELGQAVRHSLTVEPETALRPWMAAWR